MHHTIEPNIMKNEGKTTAMIEERTSKVPSGAFLGLAVASIAGSAALMLSGRRQAALFVGQWVPTLLLIGVYNKVVKLEDELLFGGAGEPRITPA